MTIEKVRIRFRPFAFDDVNTTITWRNEHDLRLMAMFHPFPITGLLEKEWVESIITDKNSKTIYFAIETISESKLIGYFQLKNINWISRTAWLGIIIGDRNCRGMGYGEESMEIGLEYASTSINLRKISLEVIGVNKSAINLYERLGFVKEGVLKQHFYFSGLYYDVFIMSLML